MAAWGAERSAPTHSDAILRHRARGACFHRGTPDGSQRLLPRRGMTAVRRPPRARDVLRHRPLRFHRAMAGPFLLLRRRCLPVARAWRAVHRLPPMRVVPHRLPERDEVPRPLRRTKVVLLLLRPHQTKVVPRHHRQTRAALLLRHRRRMKAVRRLLRRRAEPPLRQGAHHRRRRHGRARDGRRPRERSGPPWPAPSASRRCADRKEVNA
ncbi:hypothetical protein VT03_12510 [Planctomyces sp. SH-PL14]|nr:hypothetical protein VT03_12510 [Planctomyces sp. SH-PL14]